MSKKIAKVVKIQLPAGEAKPGAALASAGIVMPKFCTEFNEKTADKKGNIIPVIITAYEDKSFTFITKLPPVAYYIKQAAGVKSASKEPGKSFAGQITLAQVKEIAQTKLPDLNCSTVESAMNMVKGQAVSMGIKVVE